MKDPNLELILRLLNLGWSVFISEKKKTYFQKQQSKLSSTPKLVTLPCLQWNKTSHTVSVTRMGENVPKLVTLPCLQWNKTSHTVSVTRGRCYDHNFLRFLTIFGEKLAFFLKTNVMIKISHILTLFWVKNANFFAEIFGENIFKIITTVPDWAKIHRNRSPFLVSSVTKLVTRFKTNRLERKQTILYRRRRNDIETNLLRKLQKLYFETLNFWAKYPVNMYSTV
jgi:hypothetical protein